MKTCDRCGDGKETYNMRTGGSRCCYSLACNRRRELLETGAAIGFGISGMFDSIRRNHGRHKLPTVDPRQIDLEEYINERSKT